MKTILFQGDSITDAMRDKNNPESLGYGYPLFVAGKLGFEEPGAYRFLNRAVSGNRSVDIYARIKKDIINLKPDYLSFLFGVNDIWHEYAWKNGVPPEKFNKIYRMLLDEVKEALPETKIFLLEPYVLNGSTTGNTEEHPNRWEYFSENVRTYAKIVDEIGKDYGLPVVPLYTLFNEAYEKSKESLHWTPDGVHPNFAGHELIAREWLRVFQNEIR